MGNDIFTKLKTARGMKNVKKSGPCYFANNFFFLKFLMIKHDHLWEKWTPDLASKLKLSIDFRSENGSDEFWVRWHTMLWFSTCPSPFPIGVYDTDKHYTTNQSLGQNQYGIVFEFGDIKGLYLFFSHVLYLSKLSNRQDWYLGWFFWRSRRRSLI